MDAKSERAWIQQLRDCLYQLNDEQLARYAAQYPQDVQRLQQAIARSKANGKSK